MDGYLATVDELSTNRLRVRPAWMSAIFEEWQTSFWRRFCEQYPEVCHGVQRDFPKLFEPDPWAQVATGGAIAELLNPVGFVGPDQEGGPDPNGPLGPYIRETLISLSLVQLAGSLADHDLGREIQGMAGRMAQIHTERLQEAIANR